MGGRCVWDGARIHPRFNPGSEQLKKTWAVWICATYLGGTDLSNTIGAGVALCWCGFYWGKGKLLFLFSLAEPLLTLNFHWIQGRATRILFQSKFRLDCSTKILVVILLNSLGFISEQSCTALFYRTFKQFWRGTEKSLRLSGPSCLTLGVFNVQFIATEAFVKGCWYITWLHRSPIVSSTRS